MVAANTSWVSHGVYTLQQAAGILRIRPHMVNRWVYGSPLGEAALCAEYPDNYGEIVTFLDLVQTMAIRDIRSTKRLTLEKIRQTVEVANQLGIEFPFARKHTTYVFSDDVVLRLGDDRLIQVTGKYKENSLMEPIV